MTLQIGTLHDPPTDKITLRFWLTGQAITFRDIIFILSASLLVLAVFLKRFISELSSVSITFAVFLFNDSNSSNAASVRVNAKKLRQDLGLNTEGDLRIILAAAEKLKPGLYQYVLGERKYDSKYLPNMADIL